MYKYVLLDLDGTLTDPVEGITKSTKHALDYFNIESDLNDLRKFIGPPLRDSFKDFYNLNADDTEKAVEKYREYYLDKGIYENELYDGIHKLLSTLKSDGRVLILATSKVNTYAEEVLRHFGIRDYFDFISGSELDGTRSKKDEVIRYAIDGVGIKDLDKAIMIGDRKHDIYGAKACGVKSIGVLYGYGSLDELKEAGADFIVNNIDELIELLTKA